jgi:hypothetical protein
MNEIIKVGAVFDNTKIQPKWFIWGKQRLDITKIHYTWNERHGKNTIRHFSVSDGLNVFELAYSTEESQWKLLATDTQDRNG